jgi:hypothetical protein
MFVHVTLSVCSFVGKRSAKANLAWFPQPINSVVALVSGLTQVPALDNLSFFIFSGDKRPAQPQCFIPIAKRPPCPKNPASRLFRSLSNLAHPELFVGTRSTRKALRCSFSGCHPLAKSLMTQIWGKVGTKEIGEDMNRVAW